MSEKANVVESLARGIRILEVLSRAGGPLGNGQIAREAHLPPSTVSRLTDTLLRLGYLRLDHEHGTYALTPKNLRLGYPVLAAAAVTGRTQRALDEMARATGATTALAVRDELHVTFLATARGRDPRAVDLAVGGRLPISTSAAGIALVSAMVEPNRSRLVRNIHSDLQSRGRSADHFDAALVAAADGCVVLQGGWRSDIGGVAAPVRSGGQLYSLTLAPRVDRMDEASVDAMIAVLQQAVDQIGD